MKTVISRWSQERRLLRGGFPVSHTLVSPDFFLLVVIAPLFTKELFHHSIFFWLSNLQFMYLLPKCWPFFLFVLQYPHSRSILIRNFFLLWFLSLSPYFSLIFTHTNKQNLPETCTFLNIVKEIQQIFARYSYFRSFTASSNQLLFCVQSSNSWTE